jgi:uncharacterized protein
MQKATQEQIRQLKRRSAPINYSNVSVNQCGELESRSALLDERIVEGYGCIWGVKNSHGEIFLRGAFSKSIQEMGPGATSSYHIKFRDEHGRACALFDVLIEDEIGLYFKTKPLDAVQWADDLLVQLRSGTINNFSNGFRYIWDKIEYDTEQDALVIIEARLFEISAVAIPSDLATYACRSADDFENLLDETEKFIITLPRAIQLEARKIFARYTSLAEPVEHRNTPLDNEPNAEGDIDYSALIAELKTRSVIDYDKAPEKTFWESLSNQ